MFTDIKRIRSAKCHQNFMFYGLFKEQRKTEKGKADLICYVDLFKLPLKLTEISFLEFDIFWSELVLLTTHRCSQT